MRIPGEKQDILGPAGQGVKSVAIYMLISALIAILHLFTRWRAFVSTRNMVVGKLVRRRRQNVSIDAVPFCKASTPPSYVDACRIRTMHQHML